MNMRWGTVHKKLHHMDRSGPFSEGVGVRTRKEKGVRASEYGSWAGDWDG